MFQPLGKPRHIRDTVLFRLVVVGLLILALMIPLAMVRGLISERQSRFQQVGREIASTWGASQTLGGPVLTVPYRWQEKDDKGKLVTCRSFARFLPDVLNVEGRIAPERRHRGIFETVVYTADLNVSGSFRRPDFTALNPAEVSGVEVLWKEAYLSVGIPDVRGIRARIAVDWAGHELPLAPGGAEVGLWKTGLKTDVELPDLAAGKADEIYAFRFQLGLNGSSDLSFLPFGGQTTITLASPWDSPKFIGNLLPATRKVSGTGFESTWQVNSYGRSYPQRWAAAQAETVAGEPEIAASSVGVELLIPVDAYQKTERSTKYGILFLVLTFLTFFLFEVFNPLRLHPVQYLLVGAGLCLFYLLLLSISEHFAFGLAYLIAAAPTVLLIGGYAAAVLRGRLRALVMTLVLGALYGYLYVLLQLEDYALLLGSLGLFAILALVMFLTRRIDWYGGRKEEVAEAAPAVG
jgi:inner membrane protein